MTNRIRFNRKYKMKPLRLLRAATSQFPRLAGSAFDGQVKKISAGVSHKDWNKDVGFRSLKIAASNLAEVFYGPDTIKQDELKLLVDSIVEGRTPEDLLFQVSLDWGVDLTLPIRKDPIQNKTIFFVDENALLACFESGVTESLVKELAKFKPLRAVFRDNGFASDAVKINVEQIFKQLSPSTEVRSI